MNFTIESISKSIIKHRGDIVINGNVVSLPPPKSAETHTQQQIHEDAMLKATEIYKQNTKTQRREVKVLFENGETINTSMSAHLTDEEIREYYKIGRQFNISFSARDVLTKVKEVEILK